ncbi:hypothetical protein [Pseudoalteromonas sp.]|uniref:hypothetical protein n=1 Tax=Pseudoalteromonas sp. TaxID=53249 RepID=UPI002729A01E|nr:hypothetical protein [Pseudoalteromonas sp.]
MPRPVFKIEDGTELQHLRKPQVSCVVVEFKKPPQQTTVRYQNGYERKWSLSHLRKYYQIKD